ncbi:hypothetical protein Aduo_012046 [Ancylostoma duodenale]
MACSLLCAESPEAQFRAFRFQLNLMLDVACAVVLCRVENPSSPSPLTSPIGLVIELIAQAGLALIAGPDIRARALLGPHLCSPPRRRRVAFFRVEFKSSALVFVVSLAILSRTDFICDFSPDKKD